MFWLGNTKTLLHWKEPSIYQSSHGEVPLYGWLLYGGQSFLIWFLGLHFVLTFGQWLKHGKIGYEAGMLFFTIAAGLLGFAVKLAPVFIRRKILITNQGIFIQDLNGLAQYDYEKIVTGKLSKAESLERLRKG